MTVATMRYRFRREVALADVEATLLLALVGARSLHGEEQVRREAGHCLDPRRRVCLVKCRTRVGRDFNRLFRAFLTCEFGPQAFRVEPLIAAKGTMNV